MKAMQDSKSILLAGGDAEFSKTIKAILNLYGYRVAMANDGSKVFDLLAEEEFDLIISELKMPGFGGTALLEELKKTKAATPVIVLTASGDVESYLRVMNLGAFDYLEKSVKATEILRIVRQAIDAASTCHISPG
jgi:DNA-binding NtrC family response regulator